MTLHRRLLGMSASLSFLRGVPVQKSEPTQTCKYCKVDLQQYHHKRNCFTQLPDLPTKRILDMAKMESSWLMGHEGKEMPREISSEEGCYFLAGEECRSESVGDIIIPDIASATLAPVHAR